MMLDERAWHMSPVSDLDLSSDNARNQLSSLFEMMRDF